MLLAEWDTTTQTLLALIDDTAPIPRQPTGHSAGPGAEVALLEVHDVYPDPWLPGFPELEGPWVVQPLAGGRLVRSWPTSDFSPDRLRQALADRVRTRARMVLGTSDWTVTRFVETGKAIPDEVAQERAHVRAWCDATLRNLDEVPAAALLDFPTTIPPHLLPGWVS